MLIFKCLFHTCNIYRKTETYYLKILSFSCTLYLMYLYLYTCTSIFSAKFKFLYYCVTFPVQTPEKGNNCQKDVNITTTVQLVAVLFQLILTTLAVMDKIVLLVITQRSVAVNLFINHRSILAG